MSQLCYFALFSSDGCAFNSCNRAHSLTVEHLAPHVETPEAVVQQAEQIGSLCPIYLRGDNCEQCDEDDHILTLDMLTATARTAIENKLNKDSRAQSQGRNRGYNRGNNRGRNNYRGRGPNFPHRPYAGGQMVVYQESPAVYQPQSGALITASEQKIAELEKKLKVQEKEKCRKKELKKLEKKIAEKYEREKEAEKRELEKKLKQVKKQSELALKQEKARLEHQREMDLFRQQTSSDHLEQMRRNQELDSKYALDRQLDAMRLENERTVAQAEDQAKEAKREAAAAKAAAEAKPSIIYAPGGYGWNCPHTYRGRCGHSSCYNY